MPRHQVRPGGQARPADMVSTSLETILDGVLSGVRRDVPGEIGTAVSVAHPDPRRGGGELRVLAATGVGKVLPSVTTGYLWGPSLLVAAGEEPIVTDDLWHDPRWPHLTLESVSTQLPVGERADVALVRGVAAVPGVWDDDGIVVLSTYLDRAADQRTAAVLRRHEQLVASAITIADVATRTAEQADNVLDALTSRAVIEQAKGAVMALKRCDAEQAWTVLRITSQQFNVKIRELAFALVEHIGETRAEQSLATEAAHRTACLLWAELGRSTSVDDVSLGTPESLTDRLPR